ncbi:hypothetical protein LWI28_003291 [Acer negundo]|uniref:TOD1/MUCI70 glycosyltransferase-like domain-containing protein n=1 Tax=Acer negundo TaxID=4023 RepID=A0AAD5JGM5_ACENE|nr:hypothetical protein LWI28_003291 [Acer negundo]KAK4859890.1 hypothetical protein QYF36_013651 [Acer negundo]
MAQYRQSGTERHGASSNDYLSIGIRNTAPYSKPARARRSARLDKCCRRFSIGSVIVVLFLVLLVTVLAYFYISGYSSDDDDDNNNSNNDKGINSYHVENDDMKNDLDFLTNVTRTDTHKVLGFGKGSVLHGRDSRYWDKDDRRRDNDYNEDVVEHASMSGRSQSTNTGHVNADKKVSFDDPLKGSAQKGVGLYNEAGRNELKMYEAEYEASLKTVGHSENENGNKNRQPNDKDFGVHSEAIDVDDEYDDIIELDGTQVKENEDYGHEKADQSDPDVGKIQNEYRKESSDFLVTGTQDQSIAEDVEEASSISLRSRNLGGVVKNSRRGNIIGEQSTKGSRSESKRKPRRRSSCEMKFLNSTAQLVEPLEGRKFARFSLQYTEVEEKPDGEAQWEPRFAGHQSLREREESFLAHDQKINCGFVKGPEGSPSTGFDLSEDDANYISRCHIAVISCIFGNSDRLRVPAGKTITRLSRKNVCFVMFMDERTLETLSSEGHVPDRTGFIGLWRIVVVKNLPYDDMRRVGKIPKLLPHRLFPSARYSIWLDSKLRLQLDPLLILEYFLWRKGYEYAISNHYDRHCVWEEVAQNKKLNKYNHTVIDQQFAFYQADGLHRFVASDPKKLLPSNVPEGSFILSFAYTYQKLRRMNSGKPFYLNMFKDCERRTIAKLFRHRTEEKRNVH